MLVNRELPVAHPGGDGGRRTYGFSAYLDGAVAALEASTPGMGPSAQMWTTREGLATIRDAINAVLVATDD